MDLSRKLIEWHPRNGTMFQLCGSKLELYKVSMLDHQRVANVCKTLDNTNGQITCMEFYPHALNDTNRALTAYGNTSGNVFLLDWLTERETSLFNIRKTSGRSCTGIAWNRTTPNQLAAGFDKLRNEFSAVVWDIEYEKTLNSGEVKDETQPAHKFLFGEAVSCLSWLNDGCQLVTGTSKGWIRICDTRTGKSSELSIRINDGDKVCKVKGIRADPFNQYSVAVFCDLAGDTVKILDIRKGSSGGSSKQLAQVCSILPENDDFDGEINPLSAVVDVAWSPNRAGLLAVASSFQSCIPIYSINRLSLAKDLIQTPVYSISIPSYARAISWQDQIHSSEDGMGGSRGSNRLLVATASGVLDMEVRDRRALGFSPALSTSAEVLCHSCDGFIDDMRYIDANLELKKSNAPDDQSKVICPKPDDFNADIDSTMRRRATAGYSLDPRRNLQVFSDELDELFAVDGMTTAVRFDRCEKHLSLFRLWGWVDRLEFDDDRVDLGVSGVAAILKSTVSSPSKHTYFGVPIYLAEDRTRVRKVCGWTDLWNPDASLQNTSKHSKVSSSGSCEDMDGNTLVELMEDIEDIDSFERAAALALWHGNPMLAVDILKRNADNQSPSNQDVFSVPLSTPDVSDGTFHVNLRDKADWHSEQDRNGWDLAVCESYRHVISIVAMCIAGFSNSIRFDITSKQMWESMCHYVLSLISSSSRQASIYLSSICQFLLGCLNDTPDFSFLMSHAKLPLEDRISFGCIYMSDSVLSKWLEESLVHAKHNGLVEGLIISGLSEDGIGILQEYLDRSSDIQTCALLASRKIHARPLNADATTIEWRWLFEYRQWLNRWQMFIERAKLDVELGKLQRAISTGKEYGVSQAPGASATSGSLAPHKNASQSALSGGPAGSKGSSGQSSNARGNRQLYNLPFHCDEPHVLLRCNYCSASLPSDIVNQQQQAAHLRKLKPIINSCPSCKRQLPRCYVCRLYLGLINPHLEFNRVLAQRRNQAEQLNSPQTASAANVNEYHYVLELGQWFFFCQRCKHGGHANCLDNWFGNNSNSESVSSDSGSNRKREVCGVNNCSCNCMLFD